WVFLSIGIGLGSWWAYYELGWGGWWFWDPVENASFMPWLIAAALLHSAIVVEKREALKSWTILLAILAFSFSLIGTFIVRSGVITSVHAFASDPTRGVVILGILAVFTGGALALYAARAGALRTSAVFGTVSRESALVMNNVLLVGACGVVCVGTLWPLFAEIAFGQKVSVGPPFFDLTFTPFMIVLAMILPFGAMLPWKRGGGGRLVRVLWGPFALSVALGALVWSMQTGGRFLAPIGAVLAAWVVLGALADLGDRVKVGRAGVRENLRRAANLPRAEWGKLISHAGLGFLIFAIAAITAWEVEDLRLVRPGDSYAVGSYTLTLERVEQVAGPNYRSEMATITLEQGGRFISTLTPERRWYPVARMPTTEAGLSSGFLRDVYVVIGERRDGGWAVQSYIKPMANWLWGSMIMMAVGGFVSLSDRRYRLGAPALRRRPEPVPAE
ncbi:MAG: heme lyase CcmF/NrfE family subunit, partial [Pseudomonadota bacterium]